MANHESLDSHIKPQAERQSIFDRPFSRRKVVTGAGVTALGLAAVGFVGCGGETNGENNGSGVENNPTPTPETDFKVGEAVVFLDALPNGLDEITIANAIPQNLVIRKGSSLVTKSIFLSADGKRHAVVTITDPARVNSTGEEAVFAGVIQDKLADDQKADGMSSYADLVGANGSKYEVKGDRSTLEIKDGHKKFLPMVSVDTVAEDKAEAGIFYVDRDPLKKDHPLLENPVVPQPDVSTVPEGSTFTKTADGRVVLKDASGAEIARARYYPWKKEWKWVKDPESVSDYTIREYADAGNSVCGIFVGDLSSNTSRLNDPNYIDMVEKTGNQMITADLDVKKVFAGYTTTDWKNVLINWEKVQEDFKNGKLPGNLKFNWGRSDQMLGYAVQRGMQVRVQHLLYGPDTPDAIINGGFTNDELSKLLEFVTKARVIKYKDKVEEWDVEGEIGIGLALGGSERNTFWTSKLGGINAIDKVALWTKEVAPEAVLSITEDHVIENNTDNFKKVRIKFFEMLNHFKQAGVPIDKVGIENNLWIYSAPTEGQVVDTLNQITKLGFGIASSEATVISSKADPLWPILKTENVVADPSALQAKVYKDLCSGYLKAGGDFGIGGLTDKTGWLAVNQPQTKAFIFDEDNKPKPAYFAILDAYKSALA